MSGVEKIGEKNFRIRRINPGAKQETWWEVSISDILGIHKLPNPAHDRHHNDEDFKNTRRSDLAWVKFSENMGVTEKEKALDQHVQWLMGQFVQKGYDCRYPVEVVDAGNGYYICVGGHHRVLSMYLLEEETVPCVDPMKYSDFLAGAKANPMYEKHLDKIANPDQDMIVSQWSHLDRP